MADEGQKIFRLGKIFTYMKVNFVSWSLERPALITCVVVVTVER